MNEYINIKKNKRYQILTDNGWKKFDEIAITKPLLTYKIILANGLELICSDNHTVLTTNGWKIVNQLICNDLIKTINGFVKIKIIINTNEYKEKYDLIDVDGSEYLTNNIVSHNCGKTVSVIIFMLHYILFQQDKNVAILANKAATSIEILRNVKQSYELLPKWLQQGVVRWNAGSIQLENNCVVFASATSSSSIRGRSISVLFIDETSFILPGVWEEFFQSTFPTISSSSTSKAIFVSTPNGLNHFYRIWKESEEGKNQFIRTRVDWWQVPGRDELWKETMLSTLGFRKFSQEFGNEFQGSSETLIEMQFLVKLKHMIPFNILPQKLFENIPRSNHMLVHIYEDRIKDHVYSMGIDSSKMTVDKAGDSLAIQIIDITRLPYKQVAVFHAKNSFSYLQVPQMAYELGKYYNWAYAFIENNEIGQEIANMLHFDYEYENVYWERGDLAGFRTTKKTKRIGLTSLKTVIENDKLILNDFDTISELSTFIRSKDSYKAEAGYQDDLAMALIASLFFMLKSEFESFESSREMLETLTTSVEEHIDEDVVFFGVSSEEYVESIDEFGFPKDDFNN